jgi:hypothetical protein
MDADHQLDKLGVTGSSPGPPIESRCKSAHDVAVTGDACRLVARMSLATAFPRAERAGLGSELRWLVSEEHLETRARLIAEWAAAELSTSHVPNRSDWGSRRSGSGLGC